MSADELFSVAAAFLKEATEEEVAALADAWNYTIDETLAPDVCWKMLLAKWTELNPFAAWEAASHIEDSRLPPASRPKRYLPTQLFVLEVWTNSDWRGALAKAREDPTALMQLVINAVGEHDPHLALQVADQNPDLEWVAERALFWLAMTNPKGAFEEAGKRFVNGAIGFDAFSNICRQWASEDLEATLENIRNFGGTESDRLRLIEAALDSLRRRDPAAAEQHILSLPKGRSRFKLFSKLAKQRAQKDPQEALAWAKELAAGPEKQSALHAAISAASNGIPERVLSLIDEVGWNNLRDGVVGRGRRPRWGEASGLSGGAWTGDLTGLAQNAITKMAGTDPARAMELVPKLPHDGFRPNDSPRSNALREVSNEWFQSEPGAYFNWLRNAPQSTVDDLVHSVVSQATEEKLNWIIEKQLPSVSGELKETLERRLSWQLVHNNPGDALEYADHFDGVGRDYSLMRATLSQASEDVGKALPLLDLIPPGDQRDSTISQLVRNMAKTSFVESRGWFDQLNEADLTPNAHGAMTEVWFNEDPLAASKWVAELPHGPARDRSASSLASVLARAAEPDFASAIQWAEAIQSEPERNNTLKSVYQRWFRNDYSSAESSARASDLPSALKHTILYEAR